MVAQGQMSVSRSRQLGSFLFLSPSRVSQRAKSITVSNRRHELTKL
jgi:hypothetical protein